MKILTIKYEAGHSYKEPWDVTEYYCLNCGVKNVWKSHDGGDYYVGEYHVCLTCKHYFYLPEKPYLSTDYQWTQRFEQLLN